MRVTKICVCKTTEFMGLNNSRIYNEDKVYKLDSSLFISRLQISLAEAAAVVHSELAALLL